MDRKPLVLDDDASLQQLQIGDELDIPLEDRFQVLQERFNKLAFVLAASGFSLSEDILCQ